MRIAALIIATGAIIAVAQHVGSQTDSLRGSALAQDIVVEAADGYRVVFAPAELDSGFTDKVVILAYDKDGAALNAAEGLFRVIAVGEKRPARWVRGVVRVRIRPVD